MRRVTTLVISTALWLAWPAIPPGLAQVGESADEARERKVMERFLAVLEKTPRRGTALDRVYGYHVERGSLDAFLKTYRDKVAADPKDGNAWMLLGLVEAQRGRDAPAVECFRAAESVRSGDALPSYYLGQAFVLVGQPDAAASAFERALARKPGRADLVEIYQALGRVHQRAHRSDQALAVWDRLEKAFPDDPRVQEQIAHSLADESEDGPALARFETLAKSTKDRFRRVQFALEAAELKVKLGRSPEALGDFESLLGQLDAESWLGREVRRKIEGVFLRTDDLAGLASYYERRIKAVPDDIEARARLGRALANQGRSAEARKWLDEAVKLAPSRRELRLALIEQLAQERKFAEASAQYEALAKLEPNNPDVLRDWGRMLLRETAKPEADRKAAASAVWRRLAPDDSRDPVAVAQAADLFRQAGIVDEAIALSKRAIALAPASPQYREYLGEYYHALKRPDDALATWRGMADGPARTAKNLGRLGEVLAGFGDREQAIEPLAEAIRLAPDDFDLRLRLADLKLTLGRPLEAIPELEAAEKLADADERFEAVLARLIQAYKDSSTLDARIATLETSLAKAPTAVGWTRLARLLEANQKATEAALAIHEATQLEPASIPAWVSTARLRESSGDLLGAADAYRTLAKLDRRSRTESLTGIARLEARLGRRGPALEAGRELLAAAPGNPETHQFFAELCFQLGEPDEGLDALRRAARSNPADPKATLTLAESLAKQFRAEEAIELYWRAFARTTDLEAKRSLVGRMADQYLQRNQLDRMIARLDRELREPGQARELALCLAQAHQSAGDLGSARQELERLLATDPRDALLLAQLSGLAEQEGDSITAAKYQRQALEVAPSAEGSTRLAQLYLKAGEYGEAEAIWTRATEADQDPGRALSAIDNLLLAGKREAAFQVAGRLLRSRPDDWELLYREAMTLVALSRSAEADARFAAILALKLADDQPGRLARPRGGASAVGKVSTPAIQDRLAAIPRIRFATGLEPNNFGQANNFAPLDFGQARLASLAWRLALAIRENRRDDFLAACRVANEKAQGDPRSAWDWYDLQVVRADHVATFDAAAKLASRLPSDPAAQWVLLAALADRTLAEGQQKIIRPAGSDAPDPTPTLPPEQVDRVLAGYERIHEQWPDLAPTFLTDVLAELRRASRSADADRIYRRAIASVAPGSAAAEVVARVAAERGDFEGLLQAIDKLEHAPASTARSPQAGQTPPLATAYGRTIASRGVAKAYSDVLAVLDRALAFGTRSRASTLAATRPAALRSNANRNQQSFVTYWLNGFTARNVNLDFPAANDRHDLAALGVIRTAFEVFRRDDLISDLSAHLENRADRLAGIERSDVLLALSYCRWWDDDPAGAEKAATRAAEAAGSEPGLRLILAEVHERRGAMSEALAAVDSVDAIDSSAVLRRENQALRLAVATGNVDRARQAAERLFGLRLDAEAQVQLAALMNQLGMRELADAVLARARKAAGSKPSALLILMRQYQGQKKDDQALQVALQILKLRPSSSSAMGQPRAQNGIGPNGMFLPNAGAQDDFARNQAIQALAKSGKLKDLIARTETQLDRSPNSMLVLETLAEYAQLANDKAKARSLYDRMAATRPDDGRLRAQLGVQLLQLGDATGAFDYLRVAIRDEPSILATQLNAILNAASQAGKMDEFATLIDGLDLRSVGNIYTIWNMAQFLMNNEGVKDRGLVFFRRIWATFPLDRGYYINLLGTNEDWWKLPEAYDYARDVVLPPANGTTVKPWAGVEAVQQYGNKGRITTLANRLVDAATSQNRVVELEGEVRKRIDRHPEWSGGKALLAMLAVRTGKFEETSSLVRALMAAADLPISVRWMIGTELEENSRVEPLAGELDEDGLRDFQANPVFDQSGFDPSHRILTRYKASGRIEEARALILKQAQIRKTSPLYDAAFLEAQRIFQMTTAVQELIGLGFPGDAVTLLRDQIAASLTLGNDPRSSQFINVDAMVNQAQMMIRQTLRGAKPEALDETAAALFRPGPATNKAGEAVDLGVSLDELGIGRERVSAGIGEVFHRLAGSNGMPAEVVAGIGSIVDRSPDDVSARVAETLLAFIQGDRPAIEAATGRLIDRVERSPLEVIPLTAGRPASTIRPNARQRAEAARRLGLWLVARECWSRDGMKPQGDRFAALAVEAARRNADPRWPRAMLREWGRVDLDLGDRDQAERRRAELLELILTRPEPKGNAATATPREAFDHAILFARIAAEEGLMALSIRAVREAFRGGSPVGAQLGIEAGNLAIGGQPQGFNANPRMNLLARTNRINTGWDDGSGEAPTASLYARISELDRLWNLRGVSKREAFEVLRDVVLPSGRPAAVDLDPLGLNVATAGHPRSLGDLLATRAVEVGAADELLESIKARRGDPVAELAGLVLRAKVEFASGRFEATSATLRLIEARLAKDPLKVAAELASHAALPALERPETEEAAVLVLDRAVRNVATQSGVEPSATILQALGGRDLDRGRLDSARKRLTAYSELQEKADLQNQNNAEVQSFYRRALALKVAGVYARRGLVDPGLEVLGRYADLAPTRYQETSPNGTLAALARGLAKLEAGERYRILRAWTLPGADRQAVRSVVSSLNESNRPPTLFGVNFVVSSGGVLATPTWLIDAAREAGKLDELAGDLKGLDPKRTEDAGPLLALVQIARGRSVEALPIAEALAAEHEKAVESAAETNPTARQPQNMILPNPPLLTALAAQACLRDPNLSPVGRRLAEALTKRTWNGQPIFSSTTRIMVAQLHREWLRDQVRLATGRDWPITADPGLASWTTGNATWASPFLATLSPVWSTHAGHVGLEGANTTDFADLVFGIPLAGTFEVSVDQLAIGPEGEASVAFGGQTFAARTVGIIQNRPFTNGRPQAGLAFGSGRAHRASGFDRVTIRVEPGRVRALVNGLVVAEEDDPDPTFPWFALSGRGKASWRSLEFNGRPEIPREVPMSRDDRLGGWLATAYAESLAPRAPDPSFGPDPIDLDNFDWASRDGEIRGRRLDDAAGANSLQSRLAYARPLLDGESVSYTFLHEPGMTEVHPSLGRVAFLIEPRGVRLHWLTDGPGLDPSGLAADHAVDDPAGQRGPRPIALRPHAWNLARLTLAGGKVSIDLNGQAIFEFPVEPSADRTFGLFHFKDRTASRVRDVVLRGDWPEKFEAARSSSLLARSSPPAVADPRASHALIGEQILSEDAGLVLDRCQSLPPSERFEALAAWVLPGLDHPTFRLQGVFTPTDADQAGGPRSPAAELVEVARTLGKLDSLAARLELETPATPLDDRGRLALLAMVRLAQGRDLDAASAYDRLKGLAGTIKPGDLDWMRWPELTGAMAGLFHSNLAVRTAARQALPDPVAKSGPSKLFARQLRQTRELADRSANGDDEKLKPWVPVAPSTAAERGRGFPRSWWTSSGGVLTNRAGPGEDALVLGIPIRGDFEVTAELSIGPDRDANLAYGGMAVRIKPDRKGIVVRQDQTDLDVKMTPPLAVRADWATWKLRVNRGRMVVSIDGREVLDRPILADAPPWLAIETLGLLGGSARNVAIAGEPVVPEFVLASNSSDLGGWWSGEYPPILSDNLGDWRKRGDAVVGRAVSVHGTNPTVNRNRPGWGFNTNQRRMAGVVGSKLESLLRYRGPICEAGVFEYEFEYDQGKAMVYPALGRIAFVIRPEGVALHRLTAGAEERAGLEPGNLAVEPARKAGLPSPPLRSKSWNRLKLTLAGDLVTIRLNDVVIVERTIEPADSRDFGLFHFADEGEARVRDVTYRGGWPRSIPDALRARRD